MDGPDWVNECRRGAGADPGRGDHEQMSWIGSLVGIARASPDARGGR